MNASNQHLVVEGWRGINHSIAIVNQFQLLELAQHPGLTLRHTDAPFHFSHWSRATNGAGFQPADEAVISGIPEAQPGQAADWTYRIFSPADLRPSPRGGKLAVFMVTELGLEAQSLAPGSDIPQFEADGNLVITPSHWARDRIVDWGFQPSTVHVVPHAASPRYFRPMPGEVTRHQRAALGFAEHEVLLLNIGAAIWNKGIDVLLKGFALARQKRKDLRLLFKDQRNTYGVNGESFVQQTLAGAGLLSDEILRAITMIPANLTMDQMNSMYGIADCYVSPYRAEGFNLPVCEAMACGTPVIVTAGGATDDFVRGATHRKIESTFHAHVVIQDRKISGYCEPNLEQLVDMLIHTSPKSPNRSATDLGDLAAGWRPPVDQLLALLR